MPIGLGFDPLAWLTGDAAAAGARTGEGVGATAVDPATAKIGVVDRAEFDRTDDASCAGPWLLEATAGGVSVGMPLLEATFARASDSS